MHLGNENTFLLNYILLFPTFLTIKDNANV